MLLAKVVYGLQLTEWVFCLQIMVFIFISDAVPSCLRGFDFLEWWLIYLEDMDRIVHFLSDSVQHSRAHKLSHWEGYRCDHGIFGFRFLFLKSVRCVVHTEDHVGHETMNYGFHDETGCALINSSGSSCFATDKSAREDIIKNHVGWKMSQLMWRGEARHDCNFFLRKSEFRTLKSIWRIKDSNRKHWPSCWRNRNRIVCTKSETQKCSLQRTFS